MFMYILNIRRAHTQVGDDETSRVARRDRPVRVTAKKNAAAITATPCRHILESAREVAFGQNLCSAQTLDSSFYAPRR